MGRVPVGFSAVPDSTEVEVSKPEKTASPIRMIAALGVVLLIVAAITLLVRQEELPFAKGPGLVRTTVPTGGIPADSSIADKVANAIFEYRRRKNPNPLTWSFPVSASNRCSVHGLLNQCMEVTGTQYFIEDKTAAGSVMFGSTNVQNGTEWVDSFETTLKTKEVEWWESDGFKRKPLVVLRYNERVKLVLTEPTAKQYEQRYPKLKRE